MIDLIPGELYAFKDVREKLYHGIFDHMNTIGFAVFIVNNSLWYVNPEKILYRVVNKDD